jgi:hypothetical protein
MEAREMNLEPCPFCGGAAEIERIGDGRQSTIYRCTNCGCTLETGETFSHGATWNRRPALAAAVQAEREAILGALQQMRDAEGDEIDGRGYGLGLAQAVVKARLSPTIPTVDIMPLFRKVFAAWQRDMRAGDGVAEEDVEIYEAARALVAPRTAEESSGVEDAPAKGEEATR